MCLPVVTRQPQVDTWVVLYCWIFYIFLNIFWSLPLHLEVLNVPILMEIGDFTFFQILFFLNLEYTWTFISTVGILVSWKIEITKKSTLNLHSSWSLEISFYFQISFFLKLKDTSTFISTDGILVPWKSEITKNSTRIVSIMKFFCTLLECKVHLSMFHSSLPLRFRIHVPNMMCITMV
jgi:hypothetical protein